MMNLVLRSSLLKFKLRSSLLKIVFLLCRNLAGPEEQTQ